MNQISNLLQCKYCEYTYILNEISTLKVRLDKLNKYAIELYNEIELLQMQEQDLYNEEQNLYDEE